MAYGDILYADPVTGEPIWVSPEAIGIASGDATVAAPGLVEIEQDPPSGHPRALTTMSRNVANGLASVGTDGMLSSMADILGGDATGVIAEAARWVKSGDNPIFGGTGAAAAQEPNVIVEGGLIKCWYTGNLTGVSGNCYLALVTCAGDPTVPANWSSPTTVLGDGEAGWTNPVEHASVTKLDGVYHCYFADGNNGNIWHATSTNGTTWTTPVQVIAYNVASWSSGWNNSYVWQEQTTWYMLLEGCGSGQFRLALATSVDGITWTFPTGGFLTSLFVGGGSSSGPWMMYPQKRAGLYHLWYHGGTSDLPTDIYHASATSLTGTWTILNGGAPVISRDSSSYDQVADPCVFEWSGQVYIIYERVTNDANLFQMCIASAPCSVAQLIDGVLTGNPSAVLTTQAGTASITIAEGSPSGSTTISFPDAYAAPPVIVVSSNAPTLIARWGSLTATSVQLTLTAAVPVASAVTATVSWIAQGTQASGSGSPCAIFDGSDDYVNAGTHSPSGNNFSLSLWMKTSDTAGVYLFGGWQEGPLLQFTINVGAPGYVDLYSHANNNRVSAGGTIHNDAWHHVVYVIEGTNGTIYIDAVAVGTGPIGSPTYTNWDYYLGSAGVDVSTSLYSGFMSDVRLYDVALAGADVTALYSPGVGTFPAVQASSLLAWWKLNEGSGATAGDSSGNSLNGTWSGTGPHWSTV